MHEYTHTHTIHIHMTSHTDNRDRKHSAQTSMDGLIAFSPLLIKAEVHWQNTYPYTCNRIRIYIQYKLETLSLPSSWPQIPRSLKLLALNCTRPEDSQSHSFTKFPDVWSPQYLAPRPSCQLLANYSGGLKFTSELRTCTSYKADIPYGNIQSLQLFTPRPMGPYDPWRLHK